MPAIAKFYSDAAMTAELQKENGKYVIKLGPDTGLDGTGGDTASQQYWMKNIGDEIYQNVMLTETGDAENRVTYSKDGVSFSQTLSFGNIEANQSFTFYVKVTIAPGSTNGRYTVPIKFSGRTI